MSIQNNQDENQTVKLAERVSYAKLAFIVAIPAILLFYSLGSFRTFGSHEVFAVVPAQEMLSSGDWIVPRYGGLPRLKKPPLAYWVIAATGKVTGLGVNELTARIPAAFSAILLAFVIGYWASKWYGKRAGYVAGFIQLTSVYVVIFARKAEIDMMLCLLTTSALFLVANGDESETKKTRFIRWTSIYALLALAWLAKFHYSLAIVIGPAVIYLFIQRRFRDYWYLLNPVGLLLLVAAVVVWPYLVMKQLPHASEVWLDETVGRAMGTKGKDPIWYYLPYLCWMPLPWTFFSFRGAYHSFSEAWKKQDARERFLWIWFLTVLLIVSVQPVKHGHYLMGCLPVFSLFAARPVVQLLNQSKRQQPLLNFWQGIACSVTFLLIAIATALIIPIKWPILIQPALVLGLIIISGGVIAACLMRTNNPGRGLYALTIMMMAGFILTYGWIMPARDHRAQTALYARKVRSSLPDGEPLSSYAVGMDSIIYYLESPVQRIETVEAMKQELIAKKKITLVAHRYSLPELEKLGKVEHLNHFQANRDYAIPKKADWVLIELNQNRNPVQITRNEEDSRK